MWPSPIWSPRSIDSTCSTAADRSDVIASRADFVGRGLALAAPLIACEAWPPLDKVAAAGHGHRGHSNIMKCIHRRAGFVLGCVLCCALALLSGVLLKQGLGKWMSSWGAAPHAGLSRQLELSIHNRSVLLYAPVAQLRSKPLPVVVVLHGSEVSNFEMADATRYHEVMEAAVVLYPETRMPKADEWGYDAPWETSFFKALPTAVAAAGYKADPSRVFVVGHSSGGTMSLLLQNNMPELFQAAAAVEAGVGCLHRWQNQSSGRPVMVVWNHNDPVLEEYGGDHLYHTTLRQLRRHDAEGANTGPSYIVGVELPDPQTSEIQYAEHLIWPATARTSTLEVISWKSMDPTHHWANQKSIPGAFNAAAVTWDFFQRMSPTLLSRNSTGVQHSFRAETGR